LSLLNTNFLIISIKHFIKLFHQASVTIYTWLLLSHSFFRVCCPITCASPKYRISSRAKMFANLLRQIFTRCRVTQEVADRRKRSSSARL